jgi:molybdopterin converting factor subunit 1
MKILFFAQLRQASGFSELEFHLTEPVTAKNLWDRLQETLPKLKEVRLPLKIARNQELVAWDTLLNPEDEVAFLPPVSGG